jgi:hypothetical protein
VIAHSMPYATNAKAPLFMPGFAARRPLWAYGSVEAAVRR